MAVFVEQVAELAEWRRDPAYSTGGGSTGYGAFTPIGKPVPRAPTVVPRTRQAALLKRVVQTEILPRLALGKRGAAPGGVSASVTTEIDTSELVRILLTQEQAAADMFIDWLRSRGATPEALYLGILPSAARLIGEFWEQDRCHFAQATIAVGWLQHTARVISPGFQEAAVSRPDPNSVLLLPANGDQHTFGLLILAEFFRREGWQVAGGPVSSGFDPADMVRNVWFDVAGFSIGSDHLLDGLAKSIRRVRQSSRNRDIGIIVGGPLFHTRPDLVRRIGADAGAADAPGAVRQASGLLAMRAAAD